MLQPGFNIAVSRGLVTSTKGPVEIPRLLLGQVLSPRRRDCDLTPNSLGSRTRQRNRLTPQVEVGLVTPDPNSVTPAPYSVTPAKAGVHPRLFREAQGPRQNRHSRSGRSCSVLRTEQDLPHPHAVPSKTTNKTKRPGRHQ